jgi:hypothetical protein
MIEKRSFPRLPRDWEIEFQMPKPELEQPILTKGGIGDLGAGGFSFKSASACPPAALFQFAIQPTDNFKPMVGVAKVAWSRGQEGCYESGAQFVWVRWRGMDAQTVIAHYVLENMFKRPS